MTGIEFIRAHLLGRPAPAVSAALAVAAVATPTAIRLAIDSVVADVTFVTYYPFVLAAALFLGWRPAALVALGSAVTANLLFMAPRYVFFARTGDTAGVLFFLLSCGLIVFVAEALRVAMREVDDGRRREATLNEELQHRVMNTLMVVQSLARQTFRGAGADAPLKAFTGRLNALAQAQKVLAGGRWDACALPDLAVGALAPFGDAPIHMTGPACTLPEAVCVPLVLALHELGTNAVKHGALSTAGGWIGLEWRFARGGGPERLILTWREHGGPPVEPPTRKGLGSKLLAEQPALKSVRLEHRPEGVVCEIEVEGVSV
ncbi:HWE histidine kinase domain-containing protein [Caulobacter sp. 17J65-9]|uniref:sensor histidine kinase n=1 Tax=Caulobacter sp. 17J65-9 TaxID=2709382 RepID=UPI0013CAE27A|nr:HWE histidine kinase domain-containing protein [Caulobacter sp. 17J65-9]NEX95158.1 DUF4118 domain-containing protein [Caulobacter sp. 17J65-9]